MPRPILAALLFFAAVSTAEAQSDVCMVPGTDGIDPQATDTFRQMTARTTPEIVQAFTGTWYAEITSPSTSQIDYHYNRFEPNGLFQYQSRVCGGLGCNDYQGHGAWAAMALQDGTVTSMIIVSDLNRNNQCAGGVSRFIDSATMQDSGGTVWRRVQ